MEAPCRPLLVELWIEIELFVMKLPGWIFEYMKDC